MLFGCRNGGGGAIDRRGQGDTESKVLVGKKERGEEHRDWGSGIIEGP